PSEHGIHESLEIYHKGLGELARIARLRMHKLNYGILGEFRRQGYHTEIITANPFVTPAFGFRASTKLATPTGISQVPIESGDIYIFPEALRQRQLRILVKKLYYHIRQILDPKQKGGINIVRYIEKNRPPSPYFLLINLMEAHDPYSIVDLFRDTIFNGNEERRLKTIIDGRCPPEAYRSVKPYPEHANYAISLVLKLARLLDDRNTLIIVTSDHGQGLCDPEYLHQYWLSDNLLRVPLWVKYPNTPIPQKGRYVPLTQIPQILRTAFGEKTPHIGSDKAYAESFGTYVGNKKLHNMVEKWLDKIFVERRKVYQ
ncbi:MAG: sulfatase-like hydrolase/transferase, partial [Pyrobaculum sp.]